MWEYEYKRRNHRTPRRCGKHWSDMAAWPRWNQGIEKIEIDGPFRRGNEVSR